MDNFENKPLGEDIPETPAEEPITETTEERPAEYSVGPEDAMNNEATPVSESVFDIEESEEYDYEPTFAGGDGMPTVDYSSVEARPASNRGWKIFCAAVALVVIVALSISVGYVIGSETGNGLGSTPDSVKQVIELEDVPDSEDALTPAEVYEKCNPSVVGIVTYNSAGEGGESSGVIYSESGYIVTNDHIYDGIESPKFRVYTSDGKEYKAVFVGGDARSDLAVLKITDTDDKFTPAEFVNSEQTVVGQRVVAIGRPMDATADSSITEGIISALGARVTSSSNYSNRVIQTNSAINPGSSGGALLNMYGQVVGITSSKIVGNEYEGIGYAIPTNTVKKIVESLVQYNKVVNRAKLGISYQEIDSITADMNGFSDTGLYVAEVTNSALTDSLSKGDLITQVNGIEITSDDIVLDVIDSSLPGDTITLTVVTAKNKTVKITAKLLADEGSSSLDTSAPKSDKNEQPEDNASGGPSFTFPFGE